MSAPTLKYFAFRGRALACRVALFNALGKDGWVDERVSLPRFKKTPKPERLGADRVNAELVTNNLPQLNLACGTRVTQSHAIARYAAKLQPDPAKLPEHFTTDLYPIDGRGALLVDEAVATIDQILLLTPKDEDKETRLKKREIFASSGFLRVGMELLEGRLQQSGGPFLLGSKLTIADLYVRAPLCDLFDLKQFEGVDEKFLDDFPRVQECGVQVLKHPLLKAYHEQYKN